VDKCYLVLIETSGNQQYIFSTNKLRENVGASELTYRVGTEWTLDAVCKHTGGQSLWPSDGDAQQLRRNLLRRDRNPPLESPENPIPVEVIIATSGKALLLVREREVGRKIIRDVTAKAARSAPGIDVCGVISDEFEWGLCPLGNIARRAHELHEEARAQRPGPASRFLRLPVVDECSSSGLPAADWHAPKKEDKVEADARSAVTLAKWYSRLDYKARMRRALESNGIDVDKFRFADNVDEIAKQLEEETDWLAVIHADGNGLGQIFLEFGVHADCQAPDNTGSYAGANRKYVTKLREFSIALDLCTERAFMKVLKDRIVNEGWLVENKKGKFRLPVLPIVLGGDDLTVVCDGRAALPLTQDFLREFEKETARKIDPAGEDHPLYETLQSVAVRALGAARLSSCAGVAVVKPHYPFSGAYDLAEDLIQSAKGIKKIINSPESCDPWPASAIDFHIHYDTSGNDIERIRERLTWREPDETRKVETRLYGRPYVVSDVEQLKKELERFGEKSQPARDWIEQHRWDHLQKLLGALTATDDDGRRELPNSQMHDLRAGLFLKRREAANARFRLIRHRYASISQFGDETGNLFEVEVEIPPCEDKELKELPKKIYFTRLLDALDLATLLG
jgi:hypothetical protein